MEPATGASTWALGSHKWVRYIGIFTRNAAIMAAHHSFSVIGVKRGGVVGQAKERCPFEK